MQGFRKRSAEPLAPRPGELYTHTAIRGLAALSVVGYHAIIGTAEKAQSGGFLSGFFTNSFLFVDFFFMLSGFIMFESYGRKLSGPSPLKNIAAFWQKRAEKILPNYYFWLLIAIVLAFSLRPYLTSPNITSPCYREALALHFVLAQNLVGSCYYFNTPLWSIAVEFLAYILFPLIILLSLRWPILLITGISLYLVVFWFSDTIDILNGGFSILRCFAGFLCGVAAARMVRRSWPSAAPIVLLALLAAAIAMSFQAAALALMLVITYMTAENTGILARLSKAKLPYILGRSSFSIYLAHVPVSTIVALVAYKLESETGLPLGSDWRLILPVKVVASAIVGILSYELFEARMAAYFQKKRAAKRPESGARC